MMRQAPGRRDYCDLATNSNSRVAVSVQALEVVQMQGSGLSEPTKRREIDHRTIKLIVGVIALSLPILTREFAGSPLRSISESYYFIGWSQTVFIGFLFAIAAFLMAYNGYDRREMIASKIASLGALGVALFPCLCEHLRSVNECATAACDRPPSVPTIHWISAAAMFLVLAYFCYRFFDRAQQKANDAADPNPSAGRRSWVYAICGLVIVVAIGVLLFDALSGRSLSSKVEYLVFYCKAAALIAFGVSWLTASHTLPLVTRSDERFSLRGTASMP